MDNSKFTLAVVRIVTIGVIFIFVCFTAWLFGYWNFYSVIKNAEMKVAEKILEADDVVYKRIPFTDEYRVVLEEDKE